MADFGEFRHIYFTDESVEAAHVLQAQLGLGEAEVVELVQGIGFAVMQMLVNVSANTEGNPRVEIIVREDNRSDSRIVDSTAQTLESLVAMVTRHREE